MSENKLKAIPIIQDKDHYYVFVGGNDIKEDDYYLDDTNTVRKAFTSDKEYWDLRMDYLKVIYQSKPIHEGRLVIKCLPWIEDVEKLSNLNWGNIHRTGVLGFIDGYSKAKETFMFTEEDMRNAFNEGFANGNDQSEKSDGAEPFYDSCFNRLIHSLKQPKVYSVEMEQVEYGAELENGKVNKIDKWKITSWKEIAN